MRRVDVLITFVYRLSRNLGASTFWNPMGLQGMYSDCFASFISTVYFGFWVCMKMSSSVSFRVKTIIRNFRNLTLKNICWVSMILKYLISYPFEFCAIPPLETLPPGDPIGGVVYLRIVLSPEETSCTWMFLNINVLHWGVVSPSPNPQAGGPPLVGCPRLLIQYIRSYSPYRKPFLYPQPEDAPCRGDREPLHGWYWGEYLDLGGTR